MVKLIFVFVFGEIRKIGPKIFFVEEDILFLVPSGNNVIQGNGIVNVRFACHEFFYYKFDFQSKPYYQCTKQKAGVGIS